MLLKKSRYNHFQEWPGGGYIAYNSLSGTIAILSDAEIALYNRLATRQFDPEQIALTPSEQEYIQYLHDCRFLRRADCDEIDYLRLQHGLDKYDRTLLNMSIAPTMACNMACEYCYEANKHGRMSREVIGAIIGTVQRHSPEIRRLDLGWYGGEPLLALDIIDLISTACLDICDRHAIRYGASLISNGYLLTPKVTDQLRALNVNAAQICLDGPARVHNIKRPLKSGQSSYEVIRENIVYAADKMDITVRVNIDKSYDRDMIIELLEDLGQYDLARRISLVFGRVNVASPVCAIISESCCDVAQFAQIESDFYRLLLERGFRIENIPSPRSLSCMAQSINAFLIDPEGDIYRCLIFPGDKSKAIGNIRDEINYLHANFLAMFDFDPFTDRACRDCHLLPVCMGGCPSQRIYQGRSGEDMCDSRKYNLKDMLEIIARAKLREMRGEQETTADRF